jgi:hypothetical protein
MVEVLTNLVMQYPLVATGTSGLGVLFLVLEFIVPLTPTKKDDEVWGKINSGYTGKLIKAIKLVSGIKK